METSRHIKLILETHRDNISKATTFEEFRDCQVAYITYLIQRQEAKIKQEEAEDNFVQWEQVNKMTAVSADELLNNLKGNINDA